MYRERERHTKINPEIQHIKLAVLNFNTPSWSIRTSTFSSLSEPELVSHRGVKLVINYDAANTPEDSGHGAVVPHSSIC
jgi:hypothetical protein